MSIKNNYKISLKKFSNIALFERRERIDSKVKNKKKLYQFFPFKNKNKSNEEYKINSDYNQILFSFYNFQTEGNQTNKSSSSKNFKKNITTKSIFNKTSNNFNETLFPFYLTEVEYHYNKIKPNKTFRNLKNRNEKLINKNKIKINNNNNYDELIFSKNYKTFTDFNKNNKNRDKNENNKEEALINLKMNKLNAGEKHNYFNAKQFVDKTRKFLLIKYSSSVKNERIKRNEEEVDNKIEMVDDKIKSLKKVKSLYNKYFSYKLSEYVKFLFTKREVERKLDGQLSNQIYALKKEISRLMNKIRKIEIEKNNIMYWLLFQIRVKEKKLFLPNHYIKILETKIKRTNTLRRTAQADIRFINHPNKKSKSIAHRMFNVENDNNINGVSKDENDRLLNYKKNLIFDSPDDFLDEIKSIENKNIKLFVQGDYLNSEIIKLKERYNIILKDKINTDNDILDKIKEKEMELEENKKRYKINIKLITDYRNNINQIINNKNNDKDTNSNINDDFIDEIDLALNPQKMKLYNKVERLFLTCQDIEIKKNKDIFSSENEKFFIKKGLNTKQEEILQMIEFIEVRICHLLNIFSIYKNPSNPNYEFIRKLRNNFLRKRKIEKANLAKIEKQIKYMKLIKEVEDKNNKLLFLQNRKINYKNYAAWDNKQKRDKCSKNHQIYIPTFEDFLFENNYDEKNNLNLDNKNIENKNHLRAKSE